MSTLTVYEKPTCTTCKKLRALLTERGIEFTAIDYHVTGIGVDELRDLLQKMGCGPRDVLRLREPMAKEIDPDLSDDDLIAHMSANPVLIQRPIVTSGDRALLARPVERVLELL